MTWRSASFARFQHVSPRFPLQPPAKYVHLTAFFFPLALLKSTPARMSTFNERSFT